MIESLKKFLQMITSTPTITNRLLDSNCRTINGSFQTSQSTIIDEKLKINGAALLGQNTIIKETIVINGQLKAAGTIFENNIMVNGTAEISNSALKQKAHFSGNLIAHNCQFSESIVLLSHKASFDHCQIKNITISMLPHAKTSQKIILLNNCEVTGNIAFETGNGEVWAEKSSQLYGEVIGGKIFSL